MKLIRYFGTSPAYLLLKFVAFWYACVPSSTVRSIKIYYRQINIKPDFWHVYRHIYSFGEYLIDANAFLFRRNPVWKFSCDGEEKIAEALQKGKGLILLSAHIGNMEVAGNLLSQHVRASVNYLMFDAERDEMRELYSDAVKNRRVNVIPVTTDSIDLMLKVKNVLSKNEILCVMGDRITGNEDSRLLPFFNGKAKFPSGPFLLSAITGAPLMVVFSVKTGRNSYLFRQYGTISIDKTAGQNRLQAVEEAMVKYISILEKVVPMYPEQWFNLYDFWE
jgi:predicted LPLAT superfamily acyltransferase